MNRPSTIPTSNCNWQPWHPNAFNALARMIYISAKPPECVGPAVCDLMINVAIEAAVYRDLTRMPIQAYARAARKRMVERQRGDLEEAVSRVLMAGYKTLWTTREDEEFFDLTFISIETAPSQAAARAGETISVDGASA